MKIDLTIYTKGEISIEPMYNATIAVTVRDIDIDDVISEIGLGTLLESMDIDEVISELEEKGYTVKED